eukprot:11547787-Alexandrium_andersonii.AAC.1
MRISSAGGAARSASGARRLWKVGVSEFLQTPRRGEGHLARRASWDRDLPGPMFGAPANVDRRAT